MYWVNALAYAFASRRATAASPLRTVKRRRSAFVRGSTSEWRRSSTTLRSETRARARARAATSGERARPACVCAKRSGSTKRIRARHSSDARCDRLARQEHLGRRREDLGLAQGDEERHRGRDDRGLDDDPLAAVDDAEIVVQRQLASLVLGLHQSNVPFVKGPTRAAPVTRSTATPTMISAQAASLKREAYQRCAGRSPCSGPAYGSGVVGITGGQRPPPAAERLKRLGDRVDCRRARVEDDESLAMVAPSKAAADGAVDVRRSHGSPAPVCSGHEGRLQATARRAPAARSRRSDSVRRAGPAVPSSGTRLEIDQIAPREPATDLSTVSTE